MLVLWSALGKGNAGKAWTSADARTAAAMRTTTRPPAGCSKQLVWQQQKHGHLGCVG